MTEDEQLIEARRRADQRAFLSGALDPERAPRLAPALNAIRDRLSEYPSVWVGWNALIATGLRASDVAVRTIDAQLRNAVTAGYLERRGAYTRGGRGSQAVDSREARLVEWPSA